ncbi:MAG: hypothetical protein IIY78_08745 [Clostridia bacterium]|nr:hypothetical protein [Clostridia bacterium]
MFSVYTVCFFGHRVIADFQSAESAVERIIAEVIDKHEFVEFLVGREGDFDQIVTSTVIRYKKNHNAGNCSLTWVMPYMKADYTHNQESYDNYYDCVEVCEQSAQAHPKAAIQIRNRAMIDRSDRCVFYVTKKSGSAYQSLKYAKRAAQKLLTLPKQKTNLKTPAKLNFCRGFSCDVYE